jgi:hypothetical protein
MDGKARAADARPAEGASRETATAADVTADAYSAAAAAEATAPAATHSRAATTSSPATSAGGISLHGEQRKRDEQTCCDANADLQRRGTQEAGWRARLRARAGRIQISEASGIRNKRFHQ